MSLSNTRWSWLAPAIAGLATAILLLVLSANPLLLSTLFLLAMGAGLLQQRGAHRATERRLRDREASLRRVVDGAVDAIVTVDSRGAVASFNLAAEHMFGWPSAEIIGKSVKLLFAPEMRGEHPQGGSRVLPATGSSPVRGGGREVLARRRDGAPFPMYLTCSESNVRGEGIMTAIARDLTQYGQSAEALQRANALLKTKIFELEERTRVIALLGKMSDLLQAAVNPAEAYASIANYARQLFPLDSGALCAVEPAKDVVEVVASWGEPTTRPTFARGDCQGLRSGRVHAVRGEDTAALCPHVSKSATAAQGHTCVPITSQGEPLGIVYFGWHPENVGAEEAASAVPFRAKLAVAFAEQVGLALANLQLKETLRAQAIHDPLTGLHNRRFLEEAFPRELLRAARKGNPVGVLMLDLDHFKAFNDAYGHMAGDAALRAFAVQLRSEIRAEDIACRYGGEEFAVILPDTTLAQALMRAEQIREGMRKVVVDFHGRTLAGVTISVGVAALPQHGASADALLRAADAALYAAKADGRDRSKLAAQRLSADASQQPDSSAGGRGGPRSVSL